MSPTTQSPAKSSGLTTLRDLIGAWQVVRRIDDHRAGQRISATGSATVTATSATQAIYEEQMVLELPGQPPMHATRRYALEEAGDDAPEQILFFFDDNRFFHHLDLRHPHPNCTHECPPDRYEVAYDFSQWPVWHSTWTVTGPRKDYVMTTTYHRKDGSQ